MIKLTIEEVPEEAVDAIKEMAATAIERYYKKDVVASQTKVDAFQSAVNSFREKNGLIKKFDTQK